MIDPTPEQIEAGRAAVLANFHPPTDLHPTWHLNPEEVARAVLVAAAGAASQEPGVGSGDREKLIDSCGHPDNCNHRHRLWNLLVDHANSSRRRGKGSPNEESRVDIVFDWMAREGFALAARVEVDEAKLGDLIAATIREVDGDHTMGAGALGEAVAGAVSEWLRGGGQ